jgi:hypothetical protein
MELNKLKDVFHPNDIEWRVSRAGERDGKPWAFVLAYVTNRAIMDRLDEVCGVENWKNEYCKAPEGGILCGISIKIENEWVTKWDGAENTNIDPVKGGLSGAMKRAGVQWGIGRYLYNLTEMFAVIDDNGKHYQPAKNGKYNSFKWNAPQLPEWALPSGCKTSRTDQVKDTFNATEEKPFNRFKAIESIDNLMNDKQYPEEERAVVRGLIKEAKTRKEFSDIYNRIKG